MAMQDGKSQADTREFMVYTDQHGREWEAWGDVKAKLHPCTTMNLKTPFPAPWVPDQQFMRFGTRNPTVFTIDYAAMLAQGRAAQEARYNHTLAVADHFNVPNFDPDNPEAFTAQMKRELGGGPLPLEPILACMATPPNGFILGLRAYDPSKPADQKLMAALEKYRVAPAKIGEFEEFADDFADEEPVEVVKPKGRRTLAAAGE